jgi:tetratricopeptide (TPR) repeat protein
MKTGDYPQAAELFESSLRRYGEDAWVYSSLGYLYRCRGDLASALRRLGQAHRLVPADPEINYNLGIVLYLSRNYAAALEPLLASASRKPGWGPPHFYLAMAYWNLRQYATALSHAREAQARGMQEAVPVVKALSRHLSPAVPETVSVQQIRR